MVHDTVYCDKRPIDVKPVYFMTNKRAARRSNKNCSRAQEVALVCKAGIVDQDRRSHRRPRPIASRSRPAKPFFRKLLKNISNALKRFGTRITAAIPGVSIHKGRAQERSGHDPAIFGVPRSGRGRARGNSSATARRSRNQISAASGVTCLRIRVRSVPEKARDQLRGELGLFGPG